MEQTERRITSAWESYSSEIVRLLVGKEAILLICASSC